MWTDAIDREGGDRPARGDNTHAVEMTAGSGSRIAERSGLEDAEARSSEPKHGCGQRCMSSCCKPISTSQRYTAVPTRATMPDPRRATPGVARARAGGASTESGAADHPNRT
jgi:hypothetical protein